MKRIYFLSLVFLTLNKFCTAQVEGEKLEFGLGITPCYSWMKPSTKIFKSGGSSFAFGFGAKINYNLSQKYALGFEVNFQNININTQYNRIDVEYKNVTKTSSDFNMNYQIKYLDIPIMLKMKTAPKNNLAYYGEFGGSFGLLVNQLADVQSNELNLAQVNTKEPEENDKFILRNSDNNSTVYKTNINSFKVGLIFGGGVQYYLTNGSRIEVGLRYNLGLTDIYNDNKLEGNNHCFGLNLGFIF
jgi:opacity protein-like surface antigen